MQKHSEAKPFRLITISISHYCEKVRWALDRLSLSYSEERHLPVIHRLATSQAGGRSVPVLVTEANTLTDSTDILHYLDQITPIKAKLYPGDSKLCREVEKLENLFNTQLGPTTRLWFYSYTLDDRELMLRMFCEGMNPVEQEISTVVFPSIQEAMRQRLNITAQSAAIHYDKIKRIFETINERLADGRSYLVGDYFSAADLTFACLAAPTVLPAEYGVSLPQLEDLPSEMATKIKEFREAPAGKYAVRLFREERRS